MKSQILFSALLVASLLTSLSCSSPSDSVSSPDAGVAAAVGHHPVVVVLMEGVRVDHLGSYGAVDELDSGVWTPLRSEPSASTGPLPRRPRAPPRWRHC